MIFTSYFAQLRNAPSNFIPVSISRFSPKWYKGDILISAAPSVQLLNDYKEEKISITEYGQRYYKETLFSLNPQKFIEDLNKIAGCDDVSTSLDKHILLCCYEKPDEFCHRHFIARFLNKAKIPCREITKEELKTNTLNNENIEDIDRD